MPLHQFFVRPRHSAWEIDAGDGYRMGFSTKDAAIAEAIGAAQRLRARIDSVAVFVVERGQPPVQVWPALAPAMPPAGRLAADHRRASHR